MNLLTLYGALALWVTYTAYCIWRCKKNKDNGGEKKNKKQYLTVTGKVCSYAYLASEMNHKPKCELCKKRMKGVYYWPLHSGKRYRIIGYICEACNVVIIFGNYVVLNGKLE